MGLFLTDETLEALRLRGERVRVVRDINPENDVVGLVVAWNEQELLIRKPNKKVVKLKRSYQIQALGQERSIDHLFTNEHTFVENENQDGAIRNDE